jgi:hypothetical protein
MVCAAPAASIVTSSEADMICTTSELARLPRAALLAVVSFAAGIGLGIAMVERDHRRPAPAGLPFEGLPDR